MKMVAYSQMVHIVVIHLLLLKSRTNTSVLLAAIIIALKSSPSLAHTILTQRFSAIPRLYNASIHSKSHTTSQTGIGIHVARQSPCPLGRQGNKCLLKHPWTKYKGMSIHMRKIQINQIKHTYPAMLRSKNKPKKPGKCKKGISSAFPL